MSISKRLIASGHRNASHPLAGWTAQPVAPLGGRWVNAIGIDLATLAEPGWAIAPSKCPGFVSAGPNQFSRATWVHDEPEPQTITPSPSRSEARPMQLTLF